VGYDPASVREMRELVEVLRSQVEMLRVELDEAHAANRENRRIIAALTQRIPAVEAPAPPEPREEPKTPPVKPETVEPADPERAEPERVERERVDTRPSTRGAQEGSESPWWRRVF
jgi:hypothetical protein